MADFTFTEFAWTAAPLLISIIAFWALFAMLGTLRDIRADHNLDFQALIRTMIRTELTRMHADAGQAKLLAEIQKFNASEIERNH